MPVKLWLVFIMQQCWSLTLAEVHRLVHRGGWGAGWHRRGVLRWTSCRLAWITFDAFADCCTFSLRPRLGHHSLPDERDPCIVKSVRFMYSTQLVCKAQIASLFTSMLLRVLVHQDVWASVLSRSERSKERGACSGRGACPLFVLAASWGRRFWPCDSRCVFVLGKT